MDEVSFRGVKLCYVQQSVATAFEAERGKYIDSLTQCLQGRFNNLQHEDVFKGIKLLNTSLWPSDHDGLQQFGQRELSLVVDHFRPLLLKNASIDSIFSEWEAFKVIWYHNLVSVRKYELWSTLLTKLKNKYPNLATLVELLLVFPVSNATVERGFSAMKRIKSDWRNRLNEETLENLMRISIEGPPRSGFDPQVAVEFFFATPRRPDIQPYGRKRSYEEIDD